MTDLLFVVLFILYLLGMVKSVIAVVNATMTFLEKYYSKMTVTLLWISFLTVGHWMAWTGFRGAEGTGRWFSLGWLGAFIVVSLAFFLSVIRGLRQPVKTVCMVRSQDITAQLRPAPSPGLIPAPYPFLLNEQFYPRFVDQTVWLERLPPAFNGFRFLFFSDLHYVDEFERPFYRQLLQWIRQLRTDLVLMTGDFVTLEKDLPGCARWFERLTSFSRVITVLGNHDYWTNAPRVVQGMRESGVEMLINQAVTVRKGKDAIRIVGLDDRHLGAYPPERLWKPGCFQIALAHQPDQLTLTSKRGVDLQLSGHTHAGQIRFPWIGSVFVPSAHGRKYDHGFFRIGEMVLCVTAGIGGLPPIRLNCRPEIFRFTLRRGPRP